MNRNKYRRLAREERELIRKMALNGKSLNQIVKLTGLGKTTIHYNVKDLKPRQWRELKEENLSEEETGELMGAFAGDGSYYHQKGLHHKIKYTLCLSRDMQYAKHLMDLLRKINLNPFLMRREPTNCMDILVNSKSYVDFIRKFLEWEDGNRSYTIRLKYELDKYGEDFLKGFVRGLMDTDGYVEISNVSCASISERLLKNLLEIYDEFGLKYKFSIRIKKPPQRKLFLVRVYRDSLDKYLELFGFSNQYKLEKLKWILNKGNKNGVGQI